VAGALIFIMQSVTENAISSQFDRHTKEITLGLEKRSNFEEKLLLDRYAVIGTLQVETNLRRVRDRAEVNDGAVREIRHQATS
jgi:hypothetical protein